MVCVCIAHVIFAVIEFHQRMKDCAFKIDFTFTCCVIGIGAPHLACVEKFQRFKTGTYRSQHTVVLIILIFHVDGSARAKRHNVKYFNLRFLSNDHSMSTTTDWYSVNNGVLSLIILRLYNVIMIYPEINRRTSIGTSFAGPVVIYPSRLTLGRVNCWERMSAAMWCRPQYL